MRCPHCDKHIGGYKASQNMPLKEIIKVRDYTLEWRKRQVICPRGTVRLTPIQFDLLYHLMIHAGEIISCENLLEEVWDYPNGLGDEALVRVSIKNLREKIEIDPSSPSFITTRKRYGYLIELDTEEKD
jgi:two-component system alkaline phosphatase synthesis response regulator PhoP/two-component system response regulator RpaA